MDPYQILGVQKNCSLEELKDAFRAKALLAHPDRGGEPAAFIQLRDAFAQISKDLDQRPPAPQSEQRPRSTPRVRPQRAPDPNWDPELIVVDEPLPRLRPARPRDPNWQPDLIMHEEEAQQPQHPKSPHATRLRRQDLGWLSRLGTSSSADDPRSSEAGWNVSRGLVLLIVVVLTVWICWTAWRADMPTKPDGVETKFDPTRTAE